MREREERKGETTRNQIYGDKRGRGVEGKDNQK